jgi:hypothetical protein
MTSDPRNGRTPAGPRSRGRRRTWGEPKTCPTRAPTPGSASRLRMEAPASHPRRHGRAPSRTNSSLSRSRSGGAITSSSLPVSPRRRRATKPPHAIVADLPAKPRNEGTGSMEGRNSRHAASFAKADSEARQGLSRACEDKAPAGSHWSRPGLCRAAGGRGMGGTRPAQVQRSILTRVPGLGSIFLLSGRLQDEGSARGLSWQHPAAPPGWSGPARNRPRCRWPAFAPTGRGRDAPGF